MISTLRIFRGFIAIALALTMSVSAMARESGSKRPGSAAAAAAPSPAASYFTDTILVNQDGKPLRLYSDLIQGKIVIINPFFTSCKHVCPVTMARMKKVEEWLGGRLNRDVAILSLTVDPETDTPAKLSAYAKSLGVSPGWQLLSGNPENVNFALTKLGQYVEEPDSHTNILIVGNDSTGLWKKAFALAEWNELVKVLESVINDGV